MWAPSRSRWRRLWIAGAMMVATGACGSQVAFVGGDAGGADIPARDAGTPDAPPLPEDGPLAEATARWLAGQDAWIDHVCTCTGTPGCGDTFRGPVDIPGFATCAASFAAEEPDALAELTTLIGCYADGLDEATGCLDPAVCPPSGRWNACNEGFFCTYSRCEVSTSPTLDAIFDACTDRASAGTPGAPSIRFCFP